MEAFAIIDHVFAAGIGDGDAGFGEMVEAGEGSFVAEVILAGVHDADAERAAVGGDGGAGDEMDVGVVEDGVEVLDGFGEREFLDEGADFGGIGIVDVEDFASRLDEAIAHAVDVAVIERGGGEEEFAGFDDWCGFALGGVVHSVFGHGIMGGDWGWRGTRPDYQIFQISKLRGRGILTGLTGLWNEINGIFWDWGSGGSTLEIVALAALRKSSGKIG